MVKYKGVYNMKKRGNTYLITAIAILISFSCVLANSEGKELGIKIERNVPVTMRDGTILRADIYRPNCDGPYPVLVHRTQYGRHNSSFNQLAKAGYIVVSQNIRGRYNSEGNYESILRPLIHDGEDGYDTVEWAARLPGSKGKVGTFGTSHPGARQWTLAPLHPPSLVAMQASNFIVRLPDFTQGFPILPLWIEGGQIAWAPNIRRRGNLPGVQTRWEAGKLWKEESEKWINWLPWLDLPYDIFANETESLKYLLMNPHFDTLKLDEGCKDISIPNLFIYGWFDFV
jgi:predicted acyl esterase